MKKDGMVFATGKKSPYRLTLLFLLVFFVCIFFICFLTMGKNALGSQGSTSEALHIKVFFLNDLLDPQISCDKVFPVTRTIMKTKAVARATLEELLGGPTLAERMKGYRTSINEGVKIQKLTIQKGLARIDFNEILESKVAGSCRVRSIRAQIEHTLKQIPTVKKVVISINGRTEDILQP
jgi:spore germination protein GerM